MVPHEAIFWVTYAYPVDGIARKRRAAEQVFVRDLFPVSLRLFTGAPVSVKVRSSAEPGELNLHQFDGKLWREVRMPDAAASIPQLLAGNEHDGAPWPDYPFRHPLLPRSLSPFECRPSSDAAFRQVIADRRGRAEAEIARIARDVALVDGKLYRRAFEPVYAVSQSLGKLQISARIGPWSDGNSAATFFRGDCLREAVEFASSHGELDPVIMGAIEQVDTYEFHANVGHLTARQCFWGLLGRGFGADAGIEWLSPATFELWAKFRDGASAYLSGRRADGGLAQRTLETLEILCGNLPADDAHPSAKFATAVTSRSRLALSWFAKHRPIEDLDDDALLGTAGISGKGA